ncbi:hypothetical protein ACTMTI_56640, partial [Nonomuraea sp. H19]|uniref:hypothetical protein n=1 Tax=Nonomuraea sp. H19 TaxID=3452206 RepID=UPI003F8BA09F
MSTPAEADPDDPACAVCANLDQIAGQDMVGDSTNSGSWAFRLAARRRNVPHTSHYGQPFSWSAMLYGRQAEQSVIGG